jgi:hypothetical protein
MRVYIAASSREVERVREAQRMLAEWGHDLTLDWLTPMLALIAEGIGDADLSREAQAEAASADLRAIDNADALWLLAPREATKGAWVELGYALRASVPVVVSGGCPSIFCALADIVAEDVDARLALATYDGGAGERVRGGIMWDPPEDGDAGE